MAWNCRGLNESTFPIFPYISWLASSNNLDVLFLSETKCSYNNLKPHFVSWGFSECSGIDDVVSSGGLAVGWSSKVEVSILFKDMKYVFCNITNEVKVSFYVLFVYGSHI